MTIFYRYRHFFAEGPGDWEYGDANLSPREDLEEWLKERASDLGEEYRDWAEHYRHTEIEKIDLPPVTWLQEQVRRSYSHAAYHTERAKEFAKLVQAAEVEPVAPVKLTESQRIVLEDLAHLKSIEVYQGGHYGEIVERSLISKGLAKRDRKIAPYQYPIIEITEAGEAALKGDE